MRGRDAVLTDSLGALRSLRRSSHCFYLIWAEGWNLVLPPNEQEMVATTQGEGDSDGLSGTWHLVTRTSWGPKEARRDALTSLRGSVMFGLHADDQMWQTATQATNEGDARLLRLWAHCDGRCQSVDRNKREECDVEAVGNDWLSCWKMCTSKKQKKRLQPHSLFKRLVF